MSEIKTIKSSLSMDQLLKHYGAVKTAQNQFWCLLHEKGGKSTGHQTPSLVLHPKSQTITCMSQKCFDGDDIFRLIAKMEGLDTKRDFKKILERASSIAGVKPEAMIPSSVPIHFSGSAITKEHIEYLKKRGFTEETIRTMGLKSLYDKVVCPYNKDSRLIGYKAKTIIPKDEWDGYRLKNPKWCEYYIKGEKPDLWHIEHDIQGKQTICLVAGEYDLGILFQEVKKKNLQNEIGIMTVTTGEASGIKEETIEYLKSLNNERFYIIYDYDDTGLVEAPKRAQELLKTCKEVSIFEWKSEMNPKAKGGFDINDYFLDNHSIDIFLDPNNFKLVAKVQEDVQKAPGQITSIKEIDEVCDFEKLNSEEESLRKIFGDDQKEAVFEIAKYLIKIHHIKTIGKKDQTREIYVYKDGVYIEGFALIKYEIQRILQDLCGMHQKKEIIETIKDLTPIERKSFNPDKNLINLKNGVYDIEAKELLAHNPKYLFLNKLPIVFDRNADCPKCKRFFNQILDDEYKKIIQELFGYCLYRIYFIKKAVILVGEKDTGKTTLLRILQAFLGIENLSGVNLQMISSGRFSLSNLENKYANIYDDLSFKDINDNGTFKMLTGGGFSTAEKKFGDVFQFINYAKLIFSCNKIPQITDTDDDAYFGRWIIVRFDHKTDKPDKFLIDKITTEEEMSGLLNFALEGLYRLLKVQDFSYQRTVEEIKREMTMSGSPLAQFTDSELETVSDTNAFITKDNMHQAFINYVKDHNLPPMSKERLGKDLPKYIKISSGKKSIKDNDNKKTRQVHCWIGLKFKHPKTDVIADIEMAESASELDELVEFLIE